MSFNSKSTTLGGSVAQFAQFTVAGYDVNKAVPYGANILAAAARYRAPRDFIVDIDGTGLATFTWLNPVALAAGAIIVNIAEVDNINFEAFVEDALGFEVATMTRVSDALVYASGDYVAQNLVAALCSMIEHKFVSRWPGGKLNIPAIDFWKSQAGVTNGKFRVHFLKANAVPNVGDNAALTLTGPANYLGQYDVDMTVAPGQAFTDGGFGRGYPVNNIPISAVLPVGTTSIWSMIEARAAYTPSSAEVFSVRPVIKPN